MAPSTPHSMATAVTSPVVTDLTVHLGKLPHPDLQPPKWRPIKNLLLDESKQTQWLYVALAEKNDLAPTAMVIKDIKVGEPEPGNMWESRPCGIWVERCKSSDVEQPVTGLQVLFGTDAVDPRPGWDLMKQPLELNAGPKAPIARLSVLRGRTQPRSTSILQVGQDGTFKTIQISDTHMGIGDKICDDNIGENEENTSADEQTVIFIKEVLEKEKPDFVIFTGDQVHHDVPDTMTALLKALAPVIERGIPFAVLFGNHDDEGPYALSRKEQMSILEELPNCFSEPGPEDVDGVGNFYVQVLAPTPSQLPVLTFFFLDSHGQKPSIIHKPDYHSITPSQINWFVKTSEALRSVREQENNDAHFHLSLALQHIPLPEFKKCNIRCGDRGEPTEGPRHNSHFYDALVEEGVAAIMCGHDHVNNFCARSSGGKTWLCYGGGSGFGGYGCYSGKRFHRQMRVCDFDTKTGGLKTCMLLQNGEKINELVLAEGGEVVDLSEEGGEGRNCIVS